MFCSAALSLLLAAQQLSKALALSLALNSGLSDAISRYVRLSSSFALPRWLVFVSALYAVLFFQCGIISGAFCSVFILPELTWNHLCSEQGCVLRDIPCFVSSLSCLLVEPVFHADCWCLLLEPVVIEVLAYLLPLCAFYLAVFPLSFLQCRVKLNCKKGV